MSVERADSVEKPALGAPMADFEECRSGSSRFPLDIGHIVRVLRTLFLELWRAGPRPELFHRMGGRTKPLSRQWRVCLTL